MVTSTGPRRGTRDPLGRIAYTPRRWIGTAGTPSSTASRPTPGLKGCISPLRERVPSGKIRTNHGSDEGLSCDHAIPFLSYMRARMRLLRRPVPRPNPMSNTPMMRSAIGIPILSAKCSKFT